VAYEIPPEVIREAIVNSVAHRDYTSNGSVQVMLFADRLEVWNPGTLPPSLTPAKLREPHGSVPFNPLLAEPLYLTQYIERMGTGTQDMIKRCREVGLDEPEFALTDGFVVTIRRKPDLAFKTVGGVTGQVPGKLFGCWRCLRKNTAARSFRRALA
jgi:predicted HTH transcriptional regulator